MRCLNPRTVGFQADGKTICWSPKSYSKEYATFQLPCSKCIECRLEYARQWAVRCVHEAKMHPENSFITLTYSDEHLKSPKLDYRHFQLFAKKLRKKIFADFVGDFGPINWGLLDKTQKKEHYEKIKIGIFVTGEYGDKTKRPHWHALIFNWRPKDAVPLRTTPRGDQVYKSKTLDALWAYGITELGSVTFESAGYCARYAAKKLIHGNDDTHDYHPISKKSSHQAIGKRFLEKHWPDIFNHGHVILNDGTKTSIPRYYEKWLKENQPDAWLRYVTELKLERMRNAEEKETRDKQIYWTQMDKRAWNKAPLITKVEIRYALIKARFAQLQQHLKGDI